ncbi:MAG: 50S ribosomal protein L25 [Acidimicrobiales bacterium]|nr:50S ribosomal protein L25 [Actinomycetota bacterium]
MQEVSLAAEARQGKGSPAARRLRLEGKIPAVLYGHGIDPQALTVDARSLRSALTQEAGMNVLLSLDVSGTRHLALARQLQRHPVRGTVSHVDFVVVGRDEVVSAEVPVRLVGEADEVSKKDGMLEQQLFSVMVLATPANIPAHLDVDVSEMEVGDSVKVGDLRLPEGVTTEADPDDQVVMATASTVAAQIAAEEAAADEAAAPEGEAEAAEGAKGDADTSEG